MVDLLHMVPQSAMLMEGHLTQWADVVSLVLVVLHVKLQLQAIRQMSVVVCIVDSWHDDF